MRKTAEISQKQANVFGFACQSVSPETVVYVLNSSQYVQLPKGYDDETE